jgi:hypothetical protein
LRCSIRDGFILTGLRFDLSRPGNNPELFSLQPAEPPEFPDGLRQSATELFQGLCLPGPPQIPFAAPDFSF